MEDASWPSPPSNLILASDLRKGNWYEWNHMLNLSVRQCGLRPWSEGTLPCPDISVSPDTHYAWMQNDDSLSAFMLLRVSTADFYRVKGCATAHDIFVRLRTLHEDQGAYAQIRLLKKVLEIRLSYETPLRDTLAEMQSYYRRITAMGKIKDDDIFTAILLHSMSDYFTHLQDAVQNMTHLPDFNSEMIAKRILDEDALIRFGQPANPSGTPTFPCFCHKVSQSRQQTL